MRKLFYSFLILLSIPALALDPNPVLQDKQTEIPSQADSIRQIFAQYGYKVVREAAMNMESEYEIPVIVPLTEGSLYHVVFIGDPTSRIQEVRMFDYDEKQVFYQKKWVQSEGNIISYSYQPQNSEWHMIRPVQVNKERKNCSGYVMLLKKVKEANTEIKVASK
jgi:hypothetical protein